MGGFRGAVMVLFWIGRCCRALQITAGLQRKGRSLCVSRYTLDRLWLSSVARSDLEEVYFMAPSTEGAPCAQRPNGNDVKADTWLSTQSPEVLQTVNNLLSAMADSARTPPRCKTDPAPNQCQINQASSSGISAQPRSRRNESRRWNLAGYAQVLAGPCEGPQLDEDRQHRSCTSWHH